MPDYKSELNRAQYEAVTAPQGHTLVVAGAGTGKTRAIVYRLAWLVEQGVRPESILLLTFTRKASNEMLQRAGALLGRGLRGLTGGTFHSFAYAALRCYRPDWLCGRPFTLMDSSDITQAIKECREKHGKKDSTFPKNTTIAAIISKARNKELPIAEVIRQDSFHLLPHAQALEEIAAAYAQYKREHGLMDYDDLLFELEALLRQNGQAARELRGRFSHILVDEYQDTNLVQARLVRLLAEPVEAGATGASVMAVGDEAQSIYAFRGANVRNILDFPKYFPDTRIVRLERNYRSTQPILDVANGILEHARESFQKHLYTEKTDGELPILARPLSDISEAALVLARIRQLLETHQPRDIAVLFRAGFHSYPLENELRKAGIAFRKYGGLKFVEAAHIKDIISFARLALNPLDEPAFARVAIMHKGIGPKTVQNIFSAFRGNDTKKATRLLSRFPDFRNDLEFIEKSRSFINAPDHFFEALIEYYRPRLEKLYPDDWPSRLQGLEEILQMVRFYESLDLFVADLALESAEKSDPEAENCITLSTVHSAKGLEWDAVLILDAVEERFPGRHSIVRPEDFEEERRLFYVACTRARESLDIYAPVALYSRTGGSLVAQSPFVKELPQQLFSLQTEKYGVSVQEQINCEVEEAVEEAAEPAGSRSGIFSRPATPEEKKALCNAGYCRHRIFGRGKIVRHLGDDRVQVNFPGFGLKVILAEYLIPED